MSEINLSPSQNNLDLTGTVYKADQRYFRNVSSPFREASYLNKPLDNVYIRMVGDVRDKRIGNLALTLFHKEALGMRERLLQLPSHEEGLHMERVRAYGKHIGAPLTSIRCLTRSEYKKVLGKPQRDEENSLAFYYHTLDTIVAKRDHRLELCNGSDLTESFLVHELAHSTSRYYSYRADVDIRERLLKSTILERSFSALRIGFLLLGSEENDTGSFLEEGYAELERGLYVSEVLGKPKGFGGERLKATAPLYELLRKYVYSTRIGGKEELCLLGGAYPAVALELLVQKVPKLFEALRHARHSAEGLRDVAWYIDSVCPGLYQEMRQIENVNTRSPETFQKITRIVTKVMDLVGRY